MRFRALLAALSATAVLATPTPGEAAPFAYGDAKGDAIGNLPGLDIVQVGYSTRGGRVRGRYVPTTLVVTMTLAGPPVRHYGPTYRVRQEIKGCGDVLLSYQPQRLGESIPIVGFGLTFAYVSCSRDPLAVRARAKGSQVEWTMEISKLPPEARAGAEFSGLSALTEVGDFVLGSSVGSGLFGGSLPGAVDFARTDGTWTLG